MERKKGIASNFIFCILGELYSIPEKAAEETVDAIRRSIDFLFPKECNHKEIKNEWSILFITELIKELQCLLQTIKKESEK